jgi:hypothetical protein
MTVATIGLAMLTLPVRGTRCHRRALEQLFRCLTPHRAIRSALPQPVGVAGLARRQTDALR